MTTQQLDLVRHTWKQALPVRETVGELFNRRLQVMVPGVCALFGPLLERQTRDILNLCGAVVANIDDLTPILPRIKDLGRRFQAFGARPEHYTALGEALLWALQRNLADSWNAGIKAAWAEGFALLSELMMEAQWGAATFESYGESE
jgi:hemoglobin-like flavoprotein